MYKNSAEEGSGYAMALDRFHSVEISMKELDLPYQFKIWDSSSGTVGVLIKEGSNILSLLNEGDEMEMVYHSSDSVRRMNTLVQNITKNEDGRLKGHYSVGLKLHQS